MEVRRQPVIDMSSLYGLWYYDVLEQNDPQYQATVRAVEERLHLKHGIGGFVRYEQDRYFKDQAQDAPNPWVITTLWICSVGLALCYGGRTASTCRRFSGRSTGSAVPLLAEQYDPDSGAPRSVMPLAWSHAVYVETVLLYLERFSTAESNATGADLGEAHEHAPWVNRSSSCLRLCPDASVCARN